MPKQTPPPPPHINKKHTARLELERRQTIAIRWIAIAILVVVLGLVGYGVLSQTVLQERQPVLSVNGEEISTRTFQMRVRIERQRLINQYIQIAQYAQYFGFDPTSQLEQIQSMLDNPLQSGQTVMDALTEELLVRQEAQRRGIVVTAEEVETAVREFFGYYPDGSPTPTITPTSVVLPTLSPAQLAIVTLTPTPTLFPTSTPAAATPTSAPTATPTAGPTATPEPTATPYTLEGYQAELASTLADYEAIGMNEADFRRFFENQLYYQRLFDQVTADLAPAEEQVWARHILVADIAIANMVIERLQSGEDFAALAAELSLDTGNKDNGGDLGWFSRGAMVAEFEEAAFGLVPGSVSAPVQTEFGWHVIQVIGHEMRPLDAEGFDALKQTAFDAFVEELRAQAEIKTYDYWMQRVPTDPTLASALGSQ